MSFSDLITMFVPCPCKCANRSGPLRDKYGVFLLLNLLLSRDPWRAVPDMWIAGCRYFHTALLWSSCFPLYGICCNQKRGPLTHSRAGDVRACACALTGTSASPSRNSTEKLLLTYLLLTQQEYNTCEEKKGSTRQGCFHGVGLTDARSEARLERRRK
jgi:hypothetical protein